MPPGTTVPPGAASDRLDFPFAYDAVLLDAEGKEQGRALVEPPFAIEDIALTLSDGAAYQWQPMEARFHLLVRQPESCDAGCAELADLLHRIWVAQGRRAERLDLFWLGAPPPEATRFRHWIGLRSSPLLDERLAERGVADARILVVDPNGFVMMRYGAEFDPSGLRKDIARLIK